jgi:glutamate racemase
MTVQNSEFPLLGVFDSGVGGFSVYKKIRTVTDADIVYYGDTLRAPYGNKEEQEIIQCLHNDQTKPYSLLVIAPWLIQTYYYRHLQSMLHPHL